MMNLSLLEQRNLNLACIKRGQYEPEDGDASLKRNTAFIKKMRNITRDQFENLYTEANSLKSTKFTPEIVGSIMENRWKKNTDIRAAAELTSLLHRRYGDFTSNLIPALQKILHIDKTLRDEETISHCTSIHRAFTKYTIDLYLLGVIATPDIFLGAIKSFVDFDTSNLMSGLPYLSLLESVSKLYPTLLFGRASIYEDPSMIDQQNQELLSEEIQKKLLKLYTMYFEHVKINLSKAYEKLRNLEADQHYFYTTTGDLTEEQKEEHTKLRRHCDRLLTLSTSMSLTLDFDLPETKIDDITRLDNVPHIKEQQIDQNESLELFQTPEEKSFYEDFPSISFEKTQEDTHGGSSEDLSATTDSTLSRSIFLKLHTISSKEECDKIITDFTLIPMTKYYQKLLVSEILTLHQTNPSMICYYCRILAIVAPHFPDMLTFLVQKSEQELKNIKKIVKTMSQREKRANSIRFIAELVKFSLFPHTTIFLYMKSLLDDFVPQHVEPLALLLENCGYFLVKKVETRQRIEHILQLMMKKSNQSLFDQQHTLLLEHAYYTCIPQSYKQKKDKGFKGSHLGMYLKWLFTVGFDQERVFKKLILMPWNEEEFIAYFGQLTKKIWKLRYSNIPSISSILFKLSSLSTYHRCIVLDLIDDLFEMIRVGMEENMFQHNQRRLTLIKFVGELYNKSSGQLISLYTIIELLYQIITFGHENGFPQVGNICLIDPPHDSFRIRLVCSLLTSAFYNYVPNRFKPGIVSRLLLFFQYYILTKTGIPADIEFLVIDTFEQLAPKMKIHTDINQVLELLIKEKSLPTVEVGDLGSLSIQHSNGFTEQKSSLLISEEKSAEDLEFEEELGRMLSFDSKNNFSKTSKSDIIVPTSYGSDTSITNSSNLTNHTYRLLTKNKNKTITKKLYIPSNQFK